MTISALPDAPSRNNSDAVFVARSDAFLAALATFVTQANALGASINAAEASAIASALSAAADAVSAAASAVATAATANAVKWISGTNYAEGACAWSPVDYQTYRRKVAGAGAVDPGADPANWARIGIVRAWLSKSAAYTALAGDRIQADTSAGGWTLTLPANPNIDDEVTWLDYAGTFATGNLTLGRNGKLIEGVADDWVITVNKFDGAAVFTGATYGWRIKNG